MHKNGETINWVCIAKGIGIVLVVIGHFTTPNYPMVWGLIKNFIYLFHMPLFFIISGYLYSGVSGTYLEFFRKKVSRLMFPFCSVALIFFLIKFFAGLVVELQHRVSLESVRMLIVDPVQSYMPLLWFVHALFIVFIMYPILKKYFVYDVFIVLVFIIVNLIFGSDWQVVGGAIKYLPFFAMGAVLRSGIILKYIESYGWCGFVGLSILFLCIVMLAMSDNYIWFFIVGVVGSLSVISVSYIVNTEASEKVKRMMWGLGYYSMSIYLFHTLFESAVRIFFSRLDLLGGIGFWIAAFLAILAGIVFPLMLEKLFFRKNPYSKKYLLGLSS